MTKNMFDNDVAIVPLFGDYFWENSILAVSIMFFTFLKQFLFFKYKAKY